MKLTREELQNNSWKYSIVLVPFCECKRLAKVMSKLISNKSLLEKLGLLYWISIINHDLTETFLQQHTFQAPTKIFPKNEILSLALIIVINALLVPVHKKSCTIFLASIRQIKHKPMWLKGWVLRRFPVARVTQCFTYHWSLVLCSRNTVQCYRQFILMLQWMTLWAYN